MIDTQVQKHPRASAVAGTKNSADRAAAMPVSVPAHNRIRERAYELYESRGCAFGQDQQDWLRAEQEILQR
jgi:hypothetical protein